MGYSELPLNCGTTRPQYWYNSDHGAVAEHKKAGKHSSWSILNTIPHLRGVEPSEFCMGYHRSHLDEHDVRSTLFLPANWTRSLFYRALGGGCCGKCMQHHHMSYHVINHHELRWSTKNAIAHQPEIRSLGCLSGWCLWSAAPTSEQRRMRSENSLARPRRRTEIQDGPRPLPPWLGLLPPWMARYTYQVP